MFFHHVKSLWNSTCLTLNLKLDDLSESILASLTMNVSCFVDYFQTDLYCRLYLIILF